MPFLQGQIRPDYPAGAACEIYEQRRVLVVGDNVGMLRPVASEFAIDQAYFEDEKRTIWATKNEKARYTEKKPPAPTAIFDADDPAKAHNLMAELGTIETNPNPTDGETWIPVR